MNTARPWGADVASASRGREPKRAWAVVVVACLGHTPRCDQITVSDDGEQLLPRDGSDDPIWRDLLSSLEVDDGLLG